MGGWVVFVGGWVVFVGGWSMREQMLCLILGAVSCVFAGGMEGEE